MYHNYEIKDTPYENREMFIHFLQSIREKFVFNSILSTAFLVVIAKTYFCGSKFNFIYIMASLMVTGYLTEITKLVLYN